MLQDYLNANLISLTSDDDFKKLKKSADEISKKLIKSKTKIIDYTLLAINPDIPADNTGIVEVKEIITKNWSTFSNNTKDTPLTYVRAVILEALNSISEDINCSLLICFASRNIIKYYKLIGEEKSIIVQFLSSLANSINNRANVEWALTPNVSILKTKIELKEITRYLINDDTLKKYLEDASGPSNEQGKTNFESPNPNWPNDPTNWAYQFAPRATKGIKNAVDSSLKAVVNVVNENRNIIQDNIESVLKEIQKEVSDRNMSLQLRSELLWWKEAAYSSSTDKSYRDLGYILEIILSYDYSLFIPFIYPKSVDYFLIETYKTFKDGSLEELTIEDILKQIETYSEELKAVLSENGVSGARLTLLNFISGLIWNKYKLNQLEDLVGVALDIKLSNIEFTTWLFHDFQLSKILNSK